MRRDKEDGVPVPILRWQSEQQRDVWASRPSQLMRQPVQCIERQSQRRNAKTYAHMPAVPSGLVVIQRVGANPRAAQRTCCWAAKGAIKGLRAAQGAGEGLRPA